MAELAALPDGTAMALAVCVALLVDILWGEPPSRWHPVVWMGHYLGALGRRIAPAVGESHAGVAGPFARGALAWMFGAVLVVSVALAAVWAGNGNRTSGNWEQVFGDDWRAAELGTRGLRTNAEDAKVRKEVVVGKKIMV